MTKPQLVKPEPAIKEPSLAHILKAQAEFMLAYEVSMSEATQNLYKKLIEEEHEEWVEAYYMPEGHAFDELKELADLLYVTAGLYVQLGYTNKKALTYKENGVYDYAITDIVSEIALDNCSEKVLRQLIYCLFGYANKLGWDLNEAYRRVHISNLSKLGDDGKPVRREDGKVLKGPNYKPPFLEDLTDGK